jgi:protein TonB
MAVAVLMAMLMQANAGLPVAPIPARPAGTTAPTPLGDPASWVTPEDYPSEALHLGQQGIVSFRAEVDAQGNVTGCTVTRSSGTPSLDEETCHLIQMRAHFAPARNAKNRPVSDSYANRVRWAIPVDPPQPATPSLHLVPPASPNALVFSYVLEPDGTHTDCRIERAEGASNQGSHVGPVPCFGARSSTGYLDAQGRPERRRVTLTISTTVDPVR